MFRLVLTGLCCTTLAAGSAAAQTAGLPVAKPAIKAMPAAKPSPFHSIAWEASVQPLVQPFVQPLAQPAWDPYKDVRNVNMQGMNDGDPCAMQTLKEMHEVIHVLPNSAVKDIRSMDAVWISGTLTQLNTDSCMGAASWQREALAVAPYTGSSSK